MADPAETKTYRSDAAAAVHETMEAFRQAGVLDEPTMRAFDDACLSPAPILSPEDIESIRRREHVSQPVFARYLNVSRSLVSGWESGARRPGGAALQLLTVTRKNGLQAIA